MDFIPITRKIIIKILGKYFQVTLQNIIQTNKSLKYDVFVFISHSKQQCTILSHQYLEEAKRSAKAVYFEGFDRYISYFIRRTLLGIFGHIVTVYTCLLYTSDAADE